MRERVHRAKCDSEGCDAVIEFGDFAPVVARNGELIEHNIMNQRGWYLSMKGRTANMTFCPKHAEERHQ